MSHWAATVCIQLPTLLTNCAPHGGEQAMSERRPRRRRNSGRAGCGDGSRMVGSPHDPVPASLWPPVAASPAGLVPKPNQISLRTHGPPTFSPVSLDGPGGHFLLRRPTGPQSDL